MTITPQLLSLADYFAGEFDNREQAIDEPIWYVHLRLWHRLVPNFFEDSLTFFAEQANILKLDQPYRQRILRLTQHQSDEAPLKAQYYMPKNPGALSGAGENPALLDTLAPDDLELLPGCILNISYKQIGSNSYQFFTTQPPQSICNFSYLGNTVQVSLGFEATKEKFKSFDKGIDPLTGRATWGAIMGPYCYTKRQQY